MSRRVHAAVAAASVLATIGLAAGLTACSGAEAQSVRSDPSRPVGAAAASAGAGVGVATAPARVPAAARQVQCPGADLPTRPVPAGFVPLAVVECVRVVVAEPGLSTEEKRRVAVSGLAGLLHALRLPPASPKGLLPACMVQPSSVPWLELIGRNGQVVHPALPLGPCGLPIGPVEASLRSLHWIPLGVTPAPPAAPPISPATGPAGKLSNGRPPIQGGPVHRLTPGSPASTPAG